MFRAVGFCFSEGQRDTATPLTFVNGCCLCMSRKGGDRTSDVMVKIGGRI